MYISWIFIGDNSTKLLKPEIQPKVVARCTMLIKRAESSHHLSLAD